MNQRYGNNDNYRGQSGDEPRQGGYGGRESGRMQGGGYEGDWGGQGSPGYPEQRGRQFDPRGWGESHASMPGTRRGGEWDDRGSARLVAGGQTDVGETYDYRQGRGGQQGFGGYGGYGGYGDQGSQGGYGGQGGGYGGYGASRQEYPGQGGYGGGMESGRGYMGSGAHGYGNQGYGNRDYDNQGFGYGGQGYSQGGGQFAGGNQGYVQGRESFGGQTPSQSQGFRGKGPKGYQRSDERLQEDISERLMDDDAIDASEVSVSCRDGVVTLEGTVPERRIKHRIEDLVERCNGVKDIENHISVKRGGSQDEESGQAESSATGQGASSGGQVQKKRH